MKSGPPRNNKNKHKRGGGKPLGKAQTPAPSDSSSGEPGERIAKRLARAGVASRRDAEIMIAEGRVSVNGKVLDSPALNVGASDRILIDGEPIPAIERTRLWLFHKPAGLITANKDPEGRKTVFDVLPKEMPRVVSVGRLDFNTEGLLLLTNDGGLARYLELPSTAWLRRYRVRAHGSVTQADLDKLKDGIAVDGVLYGAIDAELEREQASNVWISIGLREGKNREVRNVLGVLGLEVNRLIRVSYGPFQLGDLEPGAVVEIRGRHLRDQLGEKVIAEAHCNFDAPVVNEFSNRPVKGEDEDLRAPREERRPINARRRAEEERSDALGRLDTKKRGFGAKKPFAKEERSLGSKRGPREPDVRRDRSSNVWMAPGARPGAPGSEGEDGKPKRYGKGTMRPNRGSAPRGERRPDGDGPRDSRKFDDKPRGEKRFDERPRGDRKFGDRPYFGKPRTERSAGDKPYSGKPGSERSFSDKPRGEKRFDERPRGDRKFGDRPYSGKPRTERSAGDKPYSGKPGSERSFSDKPRGEKRFDERPRGDRKFGDRPYSGKPRTERSGGDKPYAGRPRSESGASDKPGGERRFDEKPRGERKFGDKPYSGKPRSARPAGDKPYSGRPQGERSFGDKPRGERKFGDRKPAGKSFGGKPGGGKGFGGKPGGPKGGGGIKPRGPKRDADRRR